MQDIYRSFYEIVGQRYPEDAITYATISGLLRKKWITNKIASFKNGALLDCGCNVGRLSAGWHRGPVFGIDISHAVLTHGSQLFPDTSFIQGDLRCMRFLKDRSIDNAITCEVLEHLDRPRTFLKELHRILKPHGRGLITVPGYTRKRVRYVTLGIMQSYGVCTGTHGNIYLHNTYKPDELSQLVKQTGFTVLEQGSFEIELRLWQKPITMIEHLFYALSMRLCPASRLNRLFQNAMDRFKINVYMILDVCGLSWILKRLFTEGRRSYVIITK